MRHFCVHIHHFLQCILYVYHNYNVSLYHSNIYHNYKEFDHETATCTYTPQCSMLG